MTQLGDTAITRGARWKMCYIRIFTVICFTAVCAAQGSQDEPPVPSLQLQSAWLDVFPSEKVVLRCNFSHSTNWTVSWYKNNQTQDTGPNLSFAADRSVLTITATQTHSGSYSCEGRHKSMSLSTQRSNLLEVKVYANKPKPTVSRKPNYDTMFPGESATFTCTFDVSFGWEYAWYHNGNEMQARNNGTLTLAPMAYSHGGLYSCQAKRGEGPFKTDRSEGKSLQVSDPPTPSLTLVSPWLDVFKGETVELRCEAAGPDWTYTWYKGGRALQADTDNSGSLRNVTLVTAADGGEYACKAHLQSRDVTTVYSNTATVTVYEDTPTPTVSKVPDSTPMYVGETVTFTCNVNVSSGWHYQWYADGNILPSATSIALSLSLDLYDGGSYSCRATRGKETSTARSAGIPQDVREIPFPQLTLQTQWLDVFPAERVELSCRMERGSDWTYSWSRDGQEIRVEDAVSFDSDGSTLFISGASAKDAGRYNCRGHIRDRSVSSNSSSGLTLTVYDMRPAAKLTQDPEYQVMFPKEYVTFSCRVDVSSGWEYLYYKDGIPLTHSIAHQKYVVNSLGTANGGEYKCQGKRGTNSSVLFSTSSQEVRLQVEEKEPKPVTTQQPNANKVYAGESVSFECKVEISSGWDYLWYKNGKAILWNSRSLKIQNASSSDNGDYTCMAKRDKSTIETETSEGRFLQISDIPVPSLKLRTQWLDVFPGEFVKLSCGMEGSSDWKYTWFLEGKKVHADGAVFLHLDGTTLSISAVSARHVGQYYCVGNLKSRPVQSAASSPLSLQVYDAKPRVTLTRDPGCDVMHTEDPVSFSCHCNVSSGWEFLWYKDGNPLGESGSSHSIPSAVVKNSGSYSCQVKRGDPVFHSDRSQAVGLDIRERPKASIILLTGWSEVFSTDSLGLRCEVQGSQHLWNYTWLKASEEINRGHSEKHVVTPQDDPEQSMYTCRGERSGRPSYSKHSEPFRTKNLLLKRRVLLSISGCLFFGLIAVFIGCIVLRVTRKPAADEINFEEDNMFLTMAQLKDCTDAPNPLAEYITEEALNASPKESKENGTICSETTPLSVTMQEDQAVATESSETDENKGGLVSFKQ